MAMWKLKVQFDVLMTGVCRQIEACFFTVLICAVGIGPMKDDALERINSNSINKIPFPYCFGHRLNLFIIPLATAMRFAKGLVHIIDVIDTHKSHRTCFDLILFSLRWDEPVFVLNEDVMNIPKSKTVFSGF